MVLSLLVSGAAAWWRNITGILDVTAPPYSADNTGSVDVSAALQAAIDFARLNGTGDPRGWSVVHCELPNGGNLTTPPLERPILFQTELLR